MEVEELVIKLPEDVKNRLCFGITYKKDIQILCEALNNSTSLSKGHGRMGDLDALEAEMTNGIKAGNYEEGYEEYPHINSIDDCVDTVKYADTIIEADKEQEDD